MEPGNLGLSNSLSLAFGPPATQIRIPIHRPGYASAVDSVSINGPARQATSSNQSIIGERPVYPLFRPISAGKGALTLRGPTG